MNMQLGLGDLLALAALIIAIWSAIKTDRFNKRQSEFEETNERLNLMLIEKEAAELQAQKRADLSANFYKAGKNDHRLKVFNRGQAPATNVRFEIIDDGNLFMRSDIERKFPVPLLDQQQSVELIGAVTMGSPSRAHIRLVWDDETGKGHEKELHPSW